MCAYIHALLTTSHNHTIYFLFLSKLIWELFPWYVGRTLISFCFGRVEHVSHMTLWFIWYGGSYLVWSKAHKCKLKNNHAGTTLHSHLSLIFALVCLSFYLIMTVKRWHEMWEERRIPPAWLKPGTLWTTGSTYQSTRLSGSPENSYRVRFMLTKQPWVQWGLKAVMFVVPGAL